MLTWHSILLPASCINGNNTHKAPSTATFPNQLSAKLSKEFRKKSQHAYTYKNFKIPSKIPCVPFQLSQDICPEIGNNGVQSMRYIFFFFLPGMKTVYTSSCLSMKERLENTALSHMVLHTDALTTLHDDNSYSCHAFHMDRLVL